MKWERDEITEDEFDKCYPLVPNHLNPHADWVGCLFGTVGPEFDFICAQDPRNVWTMVLDDGDGIALISGFHAMNGIGYLLSELPVPEGASLVASIETFAIKVDDADED